MESGLSQVQSEIAALHGNRADMCKRLEAVEQQLLERCVPDIRLMEEQKAAEAAGTDVPKHAVTKLESGSSSTGKDSCTEAQLRVLFHSVAILQDSCVAHSEALDRGLAQRAEMQAELEARLDTAVREQLLAESERIQATLLQEKRERTDGQRSLQTLLTLQEQALSQVATRSDTSLEDIRDSVERLEQLWSERLLDCERRLAVPMKNSTIPLNGLGKDIHVFSRRRASANVPGDSISTSMTTAAEELQGSMCLHTLASTVSSEANMDAGQVLRSAEEAATSPSTRTEKANRFD